MTSRRCCWINVPDADSHIRALELAARFETSTNWIFLDTLGWAHYHNSDFVKAREFLERAVSAAAERFAEISARDGQEAADIFILAAAEAHYHLGMTYLASQIPTRARQEFTKAAANPGSAAYAKARAEPGKTGGCRLTAR